MRNSVAFFRIPDIILNDLGISIFQIPDIQNLQKNQGVSFRIEKKEENGENTNQKAPEDFPDWKCSKKMQ
jgi:hypothetical protein